MFNEELFTRCGRGLGTTSRDCDAPEARGARGQSQGNPEKAVWLEERAAPRRCGFQERDRDNHQPEGTKRPGGMNGPPPSSLQLLPPTV